MPRVRLTFAHVGQDCRGYIEGSKHVRLQLMAHQFRSAMCTSSHVTPLSSLFVDDLPALLDKPRDPCACIVHEDVHSAPPRVSNDSVDAFSHPLCSDGDVELRAVYIGCSLRLGRILEKVGNIGQCFGCRDDSITAGKYDAHESSSETRRGTCGVISEFQWKRRYDKETYR